MAAALRAGRLRWLLLVLALGAAAALLSDGRPIAEAHALLVRADPPVNAQVREAPTVLTLYFSEPVERRYSRARVVDQANTRVEDRIEFDDADDALMRVYLKPVSPGYLTVFWETVSTVDGHRISGSYPITILNLDGSQPPGRPAAASVEIKGEEARPERTATKAVLLLAGAALTGALAFIVLVSPVVPQPARGAAERYAVYLVGFSLAVLLLAGLVELALQADDIGSSVGAALDTRWGSRWLLRNLFALAPLLAVLLLSLPGASSGARRFLAAVALAASAGYLALVSSVSHAAAGGGAFWAVASDFMHLLAASVWTGLLAMLVILFIWTSRNLARGEKYGVLAPALSRFSLLALFSVVALLFTGTVNAVIEVGTVRDLVDTGYGQALLVKLLLLLPLLGLAAFNGFYLRPRLQEAKAEQREGQETVVEMEGQLARGVRWELGVVAAVMVVAALLAQMSPTRGRLSTPAPTGKYTETREQEGISATLVIDPNEPGSNTFEVYLTGPIETVENVSLRFRQGEQESRLTMDPSNPPTFYVGQGPFLAQPGNWDVLVNIRRSSASDLLLQFPVKLAGAAQAAAPRSGGDFASPLPHSAVAWAVVAFAGAGVIAFVFASLRPAGLTGGYVSLLVDEIVVRVPLPRLRPLTSLAALILVGVGLGLLAGSHLHSSLSKEQASQNNPVPTSPESIARGRMLFSQNCSQCHGETGRGDGPLAASLPLQPANLYDHVPYHPDEFFFNAISRGIGGVMPAFASQLSEDDRWNILNFLRDQFGEPPAAQ